MHVIAGAKERLVQERMQLGGKYFTALFTEWRSTDAKMPERLVRKK